MGMLDGRVAIVTGGGRDGLRRLYGAMPTGLDTSHGLGVLPT